MNFKCINICLLLLVLPIGLFAASEKWNVLLGNWQDLSAKDPGIGTMIKRSVRGLLQKNSNFSVQVISNDNLMAGNFGQARKSALETRSDIIIYGDYYVEESSLVITVYVFDVLKNQLKLRRLYEGEVTSDIFDTIDEISLDVARMVQEALPVFTDESEAEIRKLRQVVYRSEATGISRMFQVRMGLSQEFGFSTQSVFKSGLTLRIDDFRVDGEMSPLLGAPVYDWGTLRFWDTGFDNTFGLRLSWYLPFPEKKLAVSIGLQNVVAYTGLDVSTFNAQVFTNLGVLPLQYRNPLSGFCLGLIYEHSANLELSLIFSPIFTDLELINEGLSSFQTNIREFTVPPLSLGARVFMNPDLGLEASFSMALYSAVHYHVVLTNVFVTTLYLGFVYRQDLIGR